VGVKDDVLMQMESEFLSENHFAKRAVKVLRFETLGKESEGQISASLAAAFETWKANRHPS
jgi:hypothetical protein